MFLKHRTLKQVCLGFGIGFALIATQSVGLPAMPTRQLPDGSAAVAPSLNRALKSDKLLLAAPQTVEPTTINGARPAPRSTDVKIGCERPFSAMVSIRSDIPGRCIASRSGQHAPVA